MKSSEVDKPATPSLDRLSSVRQKLHALIEKFSRAYPRHAGAFSDDYYAGQCFGVNQIIEALDALLQSQPPTEP